MLKKFELNAKASNFGRDTYKLRSLDYDEIEWLAGPMKEAFEEDYEYYMNLDVDDMMFEMRKKAGLDVKGGKSLASEAGSWYHLGANVLGQWLQAYARFYRSTHREKAKEQAKKLVDGLKEIAPFSPYFYDGLGMYFFEKYLRGLTDCWLFCGIEDAYYLAKGLLESAMESDIYNKAELLLGNNGPGDEIEWYTIPESICYFADAHERACGEDGQKYRDFAKKFAYWSYWDIFEEKCEHFHDYSPLGGQNTAYFHAYSHLNTLNCAAYFYQITGDKYYFDVIDNCYTWMKEKQAVATGGYGLHIEWLMPDTGKINALHNFHDNFESQCNSYAVYRVGNFLMTHTGRADYGDWSERLLFNATLASIPIDEAGHTFYYSDYNVKESYKYRHPNTWTCCTGSRPLLLNELRRSVYFYEEDAIYVAQYVSSKAKVGEVTVTQTTDYPASDKVTVRVEFTGENKRFALKFRKPAWAQEVRLTVAGEGGGGFHAYGRLDCCGQRLEERG